MTSENNNISNTISHYKFVISSVVHIPTALSDGTSTKICINFT